MSRRSRKRVWPVVVLVAVVAFIMRGRSDSVPEKPASGRSPPAAVAEPGPTGGDVKKRRVERQLRLRIVGVHDGDTLTGLDDQKTRHTIRLDAIDAPELGQPHGQAAKKALSGKVFGKDVLVIAKTRDRFGRTVGHVVIDGRDVNLEMLEQGMAWHYEKYDRNRRLREAEQSARAAGVGLWADGDPVAPWEWRKRRRESRGER